MSEPGLAPGDPRLERRLRAALEGEVRFDRFTRGLYSTDASHYQIEPLGVVFPRSATDVEATLEIARDAGAPVLPRGGGTSQCGQTVGRAIVLDTSRHLTCVGDDGVDARAQVMGRGGAGRAADARPAIRHGPAGRPEIEVQPGVVLDHLNAWLRVEGLWFPVDPSTGSRATLGGMAGNNSAGARSIRYGMMVDNVSALEVVLPDGRRLWLGEGTDESATLPDELAALRALFAREADEIERRTPSTMRNVAGYNLDRLRPGRENLAQLLVGSEGTLAFFSRLRLRLSPLPTERALGVCQFPDLASALDSVQHLVALGPSAIELIDREVLRLATENPGFRDAMAGFVRGSPGALLLVEFASGGGDAATGGAASGSAPDAGSTIAGAGSTLTGAEGTITRENPNPRRSLRDLRDLLAELGHPDSVVFAESPAEQAAVWGVRKAGLSIVTSMAGPRKPISFIEDCAVPLERLAEYATEVEAIFRRHGTSGTWYAHASVGCLHVRPALNLKDPDDVARVRRIAEETHEVVRRLGGTHSGEHGDGILRSEFLETMLGERMAGAYAEVKRTFDPDGVMNPGKIVDPPRMDDRSLFRYGPGYADQRLPVVLDWSGSSGMLGAAERCNNNGACRKYRPDVMCPSFRVTHDERHSTRGRANGLRLALTGQLGDDGLHSEDMADALSLCVSCKGCKRECPTGVDMARLKLEWQHARNLRSGVPLRERLLAALPRIGAVFGSAAPLLNVLGRIPGRGLVGLAPGRSLPRWSARAWRDVEASGGRAGDPTRPPDAALFVDTFTRWFEPQHARAAVAVLEAGGHAVTALASPAGERPLCCGRTWLSAGMLEEARREARRLVNVAAPLAEAGVPIVGLEPSCLYTLCDEIPALLPGPEAAAVAQRAMLLEDYLDRAWHGGRRLPFREEDGGAETDGEGADARPAADRPGAPEDLHQAPRCILFHGHCHQKAFGGVDASLAMLSRVPGVTVEPIDSGCCGMAGAFGYHAEHFETSMAMGELELLPAVRAADPDTVIVAGGTSCRAQIADATGRTAVPAVMVLADALRRDGRDG